MSVLADTIQSLVSSAAESMATITNSYVFTGASINNPSNKNITTKINTDVYYDFLKDYHFVDSIRSIFSSTVKESIEKTNFDIVIKDKATSNASKDMTAFINDIGIKRYLLDHIDEMIWKGVHPIAIDTKNNKISSIVDNNNIKMVTKDGDIVGYLYGSMYIPRTEMITYYYKADGHVPVKGMKELKKINKGYEKNKLKKYLVDYATFEGYGLFKNQLSKIFQMYTIEYALYYLTLRDTSRPELLGMSTGGRQANAAQAVNSCNNIESLLNKPTMGLNSIADPMAFMNTLSFNILNHIKVLPSVEQYQNISELNFNDLSQRIDKLQQKLDNDRKEILSNLTVPEELYNGSSNRWEMISRNDRLMTTCDNLLSSFSRFIKDIIMAKAKDSDLPITYNDITFNLEYASMLSSYDVKNKLQAVSERLSNIDQVSTSIKSLLQTDFIDRKNLYQYVKTQLAFADEKLVNILLDELPPQTKTDDGSHTKDW